MVARPGTHANKLEAWTDTDVALDRLGGLAFLDPAVKVAKIVVRQVL